MFHFRWCIRDIYIDPSGFMFFTLCGVSVAVNKICQVLLQGGPSSRHRQPPQAFSEFISILTAIWSGSNLLAKKSCCAMHPSFVISRWPGVSDHDHTYEPDARKQMKICWWFLSKFVRQTFLLQRPKTLNQATGVILLLLFETCPSQFAWPKIALVLFSCLWYQ